MAASVAARAPAGEEGNGPARREVALVAALGLVGLVGTGAAQLVLAPATLAGEALLWLPCVLAVGHMAAVGALRWRSDRQARAAGAARRQAERNYRAIFERAVEGIFQTSPDGRYLAANPALARLYLYDSPQEMIEGLTDIAGQLYVDPTRREAFAHEMQTQGQVTDFQSEVRRRDGSTIWISENARPVYDERGRLLYYEGFVEDISARHRADALLRAALVEAEQAARTKAEFLATISHELRTPLNAIIGLAEVLEHEIEGPIGPRNRGHATDILHSGRRLLAIINDIIDLSKLESGTLLPQEEAVPLDVLVTAALTAARLEQGDDPRRGPRVDVAAVDPNLCLWADARLVRRIMTNLVSNAVKFTPPGGCVTVSGALEDGHVTFAVQDSGIGMTEDEIHLALQPFRQVDNSLSRPFSGVGLGLPLVRSICSLHGATLAIDSVPGSGTLVRVRFPSSRTLPPGDLRAEVYTLIA
ncbi:PAS domain-containing sensor histidine kinase [Zavarzinia sp. CC-PAN008]|uniref:PAS domain-containing sensor histidine kinase n=1 Tax=Zavarzinia sp. CC-PAN008 TaxID=3243332 RepID=UPI003F744BF1